MADSNGLITQLPVVDGSIYGIVSFFAGYFSTLVFVLVAETGQIRESFVEGAGWVYYNAQFAPVELRSPPGEQTGQIDAASINYLAGSGPEGLAVSATQVPAPVYYAIPVVVLLAGGYMLATDLGATTTVEGVVAGGSLAFGTLFLSLVGGILFEVDSIGPNIALGVLLVGIVYPAVFGALGGVLSTRVSIGDLRS